MQIAHIQTTTESVFAAIDAEGNNRGNETAKGGIAAITPLAAMELYEKLHGARNELRGRLELPAIPMPDEGLLVLAFLRGAAQLVQVTPNLADLSALFRAIVQEVQEARLDATPEGLVMVNGRETAEVT